MHVPQGIDYLINYIFKKIGFFSPADLEYVLFSTANMLNLL